MNALPAGNNEPRIRLWDEQYRLISDSATDTTPAYRHIATWVNATIDDPDGTRWSGQFYRCPEGVKRWAKDDLKWLNWAPNPLLEEFNE